MNDLETLRHSCAHIMASAVKRLYPDARLGIGPAIKDGFYYDFDIPVGIKDHDLERIEKVMKEIIGSDYPFLREEWDSNDAIQFFQDKKENYKVELIKNLAQDKVSIYKHGDFTDLCRGPHIPSTGKIKYFKLISVSGAYWRGNEHNPQLIRIYGTVFPTEKELNEYLKIRALAKERDHRLLGKQMELFDIYYNEAGAGLVFYLPKGAILRRIIEDWEIKEHLKRGYKTVITPHIMNKQLWQKSGHLDYYADYMYSIKKENQEFILKPMNCPGHILIYKSRIRSWRELPLRMFELGTVYRYEKSGVLHGLLRVRGFTQDDAHIFCRKDDLYGEIEGVIDFVKEAMAKFGFDDFNAELSTRPEKFIGSKADWDLSENILEEVLKKKNLNYTINKGDGAFYGPKIDIKLKDVLKREWQCATIQLDYNIPTRFDLTYRSREGKDLRVVMIHRVILGSLERFIATLIEHYGGRFPFWLAPVQATVINIGEDTVSYAKDIKNFLIDKDIRVEADLRDETLQRKIRDREMEKIPYMIIVGKKEKAENSVNVRKGGRKNLGQMKLDDLLKVLREAS